MKLLILSVSCAGIAFANPTPSKTFLATFDDIIGSGLTPELDPVPTPYKNLAWPGFNVYNTSQGVTALKAPSKPNFAASVTLAQALEKSPAMISIAGTNTESFSLGFTYNACVLASQTGLVAESCTIQYKGVTTTGVSVSTLCTFTADLLAPKAAPCSLPSSFTGLKNVSIVPVTASLPADTTILILDGVSGATVAKSK